MRAGNGQNGNGHEPRVREARCARQTPLWSGRMIKIRDRNFTVSIDPATQRDVATARLWVQTVVNDCILFMRARSPEGPVNALTCALRAILAHGSWPIPEVTIEGTSDVGLVHPEEGTRSHAFVRAAFRIDRGDPVTIETTYSDLDTAFFLAFCTAYDTAIVAAYEARLRLARMTISDVYALWAPISAHLAARGGP